VKDRTENSRAGKPNIIVFVKLISLCSRGKRNANTRKAEGIIPEVAKPILPQNNFKGFSLRK
jgi:hypothetical protein